MNYLKKLTFVFIITLIFGQVVSYAYSTLPFFINKVKIGGADSSIYTSGARTKEKEGIQKLYDISQNHTNQATLQYLDTEDKWRYGTTAWYTMTSGKTLNFPNSIVTSFYPDEMLGDYRVRIKEKAWHVTDGTLTAYYSAGNEYD